MRITAEMKKLPHFIMVLYLVIVPATQGKSITSHKQSNANVESSSTNELDNRSSGARSEKSKHNNLLSDLARISKDEEANVVNKQTIVGTEVSAATVNTNASFNSNGNVEDSRITVTSSPTETQAPTLRDFTTPGPTSKFTDNPGTSSNANNDMSLVRLSEPTHIVVSDTKDNEKPFSKLITSNENVPEKSNDAVNKPQELSPLISERTQSTPAESGQNDVSAFTDSAASDSTGNAVDESTQQNPKKVENGKSLQDGSAEDNSAAKIQGDAPKSAEKQSQNVDAGVKDSATDHVVVCAGEKQTITCPSDTNLNIASANYGYDSNSGCPIDSGLASESCQATGVYPVVRSACHGQASCLLQSDGQEFGGMCPGNNNFLKVGYSCQKEAPSLSNSESTTPSPVTPRSNTYSDQTSPYIPHPVQSTQPTTYYNYAYNQPQANSYNDYVYNNPNAGYMTNNSPTKTNNPYNSYYGNQNYYNYNYQGRQAQPIGGQARPFLTNYRYKPRSPPRNAGKSPQAATRPQPPAKNYGSLMNTQYRDYKNRNPQQSYNDYYKNGFYDNKNNYNYNARNSYNPRNGYYDPRYYSQQYSPHTQPYNNGPQYPRNSYLGSCYACQNCQQCSEQAYCQGCPKCNALPCNKKPPNEEKYLDPIDSLIEEFGKKTKGMTPMEMSSVVLSPIPKGPGIALSTPLHPPPEPREDENDDNVNDNDDDSDENEFTLSDNESNNHEIQDNESALNQKKALVSSTKASAHSAQHKSKDKAEKGEKRNKIYHRKHKVHEIYDDDDDDDGYDLQVYRDLLKKRKKSRIHRHKKAHAKRKKSRKRLSKRWYDQNEITGENEFDIGENRDKLVDSPYHYDGAVFWSNGFH